MDHAITVLPLRARRQEPSVGILDLPSELLHEICCQLCLHCHHEHVVTACPDVLPAAFEDQKALARLSRCSQRLREIAQPVLFHWYQGGKPDNGEEDAEELGRLVSFLRPIIRHPTLAASTQALALYETPWSRDATFADPEGSLGPAFEAVGGYLLRHWRNNYRKGLHLNQLQELAMASTPALSQLCLQRQSFLQRRIFRHQQAFLPRHTFEQHHQAWLQRQSELPNETWEVWSYPMPNLKYLAFPGKTPGGEDDSYPEKDTYDLKDAMSLLRHAPNLDTLVAPDCWVGELFQTTTHFETQPWCVMLTSLKRLSLNDVTLDQVGPILDFCPLLEDLEFFDDHNGLRKLHLSPERDLGRLRTTLRRLCFSVLETNVPKPDERPPFEELQENQCWYFFDNFPQAEDEYPDFSSFPVLEELEMEQLFLYGAVFPTTEDPREDRSSRITTPDHLFCKLPPSLRRLRIGCVGYWPTVYRDLLALAERPSRRFPRLQAVTLEVFEAPPEHQHRYLAERLGSGLGVTLLVCYVVRSPYKSRGLLPARPGQPGIVHRPILYS